MTPPPAAVLEASLALVRDRPVSGNAHAPMLANRYISASRLIKISARDLITEILTPPAHDPTDAHWGENGNALADVNLRNVPCKEPTLRVPIPGTNWLLEGHCDGLDIVRGDSGRIFGWDFRGFSPLDPHGDDVHYATIYENKAPLHDAGLYGVELAYRQGLLYMGMLQHAHTGGIRELPHAPWGGAPVGPMLNKAWALPTKLVPGQVVVCLQPYDSPKREEAFPVTQDATQAHLDRYLEKARVVIAGVQADDAEIGDRDWDSVKDKGLNEFRIGTPIDIPDAANLLGVVEAERQAAAAKKIAEDAHDARKAELESYLKAHHLEEASVPCEGGAPYRVVLERRAGGMRHFIQAPSTSLRVYGGPKKAKA